MIRFFYVLRFLSALALLGLAGMILLKVFGVI
jgi:hypothetical protein